MTEIELPCCDTPALLEPDAETVRCEACGVEHRLAPDARPARPAKAIATPIRAIAA